MAAAMRITFLGGKCRPTPSAVFRRLLDRLADRRMCPHGLDRVAHRRLLLDQSGNRGNAFGRIVADHVGAEQLVRLAVANHLHESVGMPRRHRLAKVADREAADGDRQSARRALPARSFPRPPLPETCRPPTESPRQMALAVPSAFSAAATPWADAAWASMLRPFASPIV